MLLSKRLSQRKREILVAMATGRGMSFTMVQAGDRLMKGGVARRVMFLVA